jgi:MFS transporter, ACS family, tartrate transporter
LSPDLDILDGMSLDSISVGDRARRRITRRLLPFLLVLFLLAFLDRTNIAVAQLQMKGDLGFTEAVIGTGAGIFFLGYFLLEIPGTLIVERWSARKWIARIMVSWGIIASLMGFIGLPVFQFLHAEAQFNSLRFILGLAEAGFFPGVIVYLSHWFLYEDRAKTKSMFLIGIPLATIISTPLSQWIMHSVKWLDYSGWRWVFILEGIPAVIFGVITWFYLTDRPAQAKWLPEDEKAWIVAELAKEHQAKVDCGGSKILQGLANPQVWLLAGIYFFGVTGMYGFTFFLPAVVERFKGTSVVVQTLISTAPYVLGLIAILWNGAHSDRTGERRWHTAVPLLLASVAMGCAAFFANNTILAATFLCLLGLTLYAYLPVFWTHPTARLTASSAAFAIGLINSIGNLGGYVGPKIVGELKTRSGNFQSGLWFLAACISIAGLLATLLTQRKANVSSSETS